MLASLANHSTPSSHPHFPSWNLGQGCTSDANCHKLIGGSVCDTAAGQCHCRIGDTIGKHEPYRCQPITCSSLTDCYLGGPVPEPSQRALVCQGSRCLCDPSKYRQSDDQAKCLPLQDTLQRKVPVVAIIVVCLLFACGIICLAWCLWKAPTPSGSSTKSRRSLSRSGSRKKKSKSRKRSGK